jgi:DNA-binding transcriptional MocR family regulator
VRLLETRSWLTHEQVAEALGMSPSGAYHALQRAAANGYILVRKGRSLGSMPDLYYHPNAQETPMPEIDREASLGILARYLDRSPMLPDVDTVEGSIARMRWLLGLIQYAQVAAHEAHLLAVQDAYQAGYEEGRRAQST